MANIVIVDDSRLQRTKLKKLLLEQGHEVNEAGSGKEALELLKTVSNPDLVITDIVMPEMTGIELLETLKNDGFKAPIIVVSADVQDETMNDCKRLGAAGFINKPLKTESLQDAIKSVLG